MLVVQLAIRKQYRYARSPAYFFYQEELPACRSIGVRKGKVSGHRTKHRPVQEGRVDDRSEQAEEGTKQKC